MTTDQFQLSQNPNSINNQKFFYQNLKLISPIVAFLQHNQQKKNAAVVVFLIYEITENTYKVLRFFILFLACAPTKMYVLKIKKKSYNIKDFKGADVS